MHRGRTSAPPISTLTQHEAVNGARGRLEYDEGLNRITQTLA